VTATGVEFREE